MKVKEFYRVTRGEEATDFPTLAAALKFTKSKGRCHIWWFQVPGHGWEEG